ncbi:aconitase [Dendrothele bispora CBS 962.96]|uniref:Aconitate hydratase, mitochondrial n=1 Tax=Dendrothele bispora (strain CBS 962.96) TaxID=1314807 RepID=A0A4S8L8R8_DENBC|nr:aconitase [Dendrothele bispora CBS 962.96]
MLNVSNRTAKAVRRFVAPKIGDTQVPMSLLEKSAFINYQRIEDNLAVIQDRWVEQPSQQKKEEVHGHLDDPHDQEIQRGVSCLKLRPDVLYFSLLCYFLNHRHVFSKRVVCQDATAQVILPTENTYLIGFVQMAILQFMSAAGMDMTALPTTIGGVKDLARAIDINKELPTSFRLVRPGVTHQIILKNYAFPRGLMIGTDSHTPNAGGLGMVACGIGGADAVDVMAGIPRELKCPKMSIVILYSSVLNHHLVITSYNCNFTGRNDANPATHAFVASPDIVTTMAFGGRLTFNPMVDESTGSDGKPFKFTEPSGNELPPRGYDPGQNTFRPPRPFASWDSKTPTDLPILIKVKGKCTTDHIFVDPGSNVVDAWKASLVSDHHFLVAAINKRSARIPIENCLIRAINAENEEANKVKNQFTGEYGSVPQTAAFYRNKGIKWAVMGDHNYGEGSSREHAALEPLFLGGSAITTKSFARVHEINLVRPTDKVDILGLESFAPGKNLTLVLKHEDDPKEEILLAHSFNEGQVE